MIKVIINKDINIVTLKDNYDQHEVYLSYDLYSSEYGTEATDVAIQGLISGRKERDKWREGKVKRGVRG